MSGLSFRMVSAAASVVAVLVLVGCGTLSVRTEHDPNADFAALKSYAWAVQSRAMSPAEKIIRETVDRAFAAKGFERDDAGHPDFLVAHRVSVEERTDVSMGNGHREPPPASGWAFAGDSGWGWRDPADMLDQQEYTEGTLVLAVMDAGSTQMVWRGTAVAEINAGETGSKDRKRLRHALDRMLKDFPPR